MQHPHPRPRRIDITRNRLGMHTIHARDAIDGPATDSASFPSRESAYLAIEPLVRDEFERPHFNC